MLKIFVIEPNIQINGNGVNFNKHSLFKYEFDKYDD